MYGLALVALLSQTPVRVVVIDVSAPDAIYEDVSRALADQVVQAMVSAGLEAERVDERELPDEGCRIGPCLGVIGRAHKAHVVVIVDAAEVDKKRSGVSVAALYGRDGRPLAAKRYTVEGVGKAPKALGVFVAEVSREATALVAPPDAGTR